MYPTIQLFGTTIGTYTLLSIGGALAAGACACRTARRRGHNDNVMIALLLVAAIGVLVGGHLLYGLVNLPVLIRLWNSGAVVPRFQSLLSAFWAVFGGAVFYGGLLGGIAAGMLYARIRKLPVGEYADMLAPVIPLFHFFGRVGCFLGGCCYGIESRFGFVYTHALTPDANGVHRFPVQLVEAGCNLLLFFLLSQLLKRGILRSRLLALYLVLYSALRFLLEFLRGDAARGFVGPLSTSQLISVLLIAGAGFLLLKGHHRAHRALGA